MAYKLVCPKCGNDVSHKLLPPKNHRSGETVANRYIVKCKNIWCESTTGAGKTPKDARSSFIINNGAIDGA